MLKQVLALFPNFWLFMLTLFITSSIVAEPWITAGNARTRHHLLVLANSGAANIPVNAWPIMWNDIKLQLDTIEVTELSDTEAWSYQYLKHEIRRAMVNTSSSATVFRSDGINNLPGFSGRGREKSMTSGAISLMTNNFAGKLQVAHVNDPSDRREYRADGSYGALMLGSWVVGGGSLERWWGPGWENSLLLSNHARPLNTVFVQRSGSKILPFTDFSGYMPWNLSLFASPLEGYEDFHAWLYAGRLGFKPIQFLELGLQKTLLSNETNTPNIIGPIENPIDDVSGNQSLTAFDWRIHFNVGPVQFGVYQQLAERSGEENNATAELRGLEMAFSLLNTQHRIVLEESDNLNEPAQFYEHAGYAPGYTYRGRPLGMATDSNARIRNLTSMHYLENGHQVQFRIADLESTQFEDTLVSTFLSYALPISDNLQCQFGLWQYNKETIELENTPLEEGVFFELEYAY